MITSDDAHRIATEAIGPAMATDGQGWRLEEFDSGWLVLEDWMSEPSVCGGSFCVVEREADLRPRSVRQRLRRPSLRTYACP